MSLFRTKEWWRTECGHGETFDGQSLLVVPLFGDNKKDIIIVSSHSGYLRIYSPSSQWNDEINNSTGYKITDLIIETQIADCIIDIKSGKFISGSQDQQLAVLTPSKLIVYKITLNTGTIDYGDRCAIDAVYEHQLPRFPASLIAGPFGSVKGRDFFCIQCLDGTLIFYEQESHTFNQSFKDRLLPERLTYVAKNDVFITINPGWIIECYRYQNMAEFGRVLVENTRDIKDRWLEPDWSFNVGEAVLAIQPVTLSSFEVGIVVLGERNLYCFRDNCTSIKYTKKLDYNPLCCHAYVIEPDGKLMVLVVADTDTLLVYEGTTLKWSAQLPFTPVAVTRANFQHLEGVVVILSDEGRLEACYLGAEPSLFIAPPMHRRGFDYQAAEQELIELRKSGKNTGRSGDHMSNATLESELLINVNIPNILEQSSPSSLITTNNDVKYPELICKINIELSSYTSLHDVQIILDVMKPLHVIEYYYSFSNLRDRQTIQPMIYINDDLPLLSSELRVTATYETDNGDLRIVQKIIQLPLRIVLRACPPENTTSFSATIKCLDPLINFNQLFPEFIPDTSQRQPSNALGLCYIHSGHVVTIVAGTNTNRYRVQSNDALSMTLIIQMLVGRLNSRLPGRIVTSIGQNHLQLIHSHIDAHFAIRERIKEISNEIELMTAQLRNVEKKLLRSVRETNVRSLASTGLPFIFNSTYELLTSQLDQLQAAQVERDRAGHGLECAVKLVLVLLRPNVQDDDKYAILESAIGFVPLPRDDIDWEEIADLSLVNLIRVTTKKISTENSLSTARQMTLNKFETSRDIMKLKKRVTNAIERFNKSSNSVQEDEIDN
ncbi:hypothetical protein PV327_009004 [Microctonus hyperodae]|uniref:Protein PTHB1 n=1 Tax=Microctonus hyperodae TaxID=165561 RepID=A0AA39KVG1_MICHY|nr:hypothetical protein PV327_009004 [Microctonus hyperodae]